MKCADIWFVNQFVMKPSECRIDPAEFSSEEMKRLQAILNLAEQNKTLWLKGADGLKYRIPEAIFEVLVKVIVGMRDGKTMLILPEDEKLTTQAAANYLGLSRQFFVTLLEGGKIPFHLVGSHRRVLLKDLREYEQRRDRERRQRLSRLFKKMQEEGSYDVELSEVSDNAG